MADRKLGDFVHGAAEAMAAIGGDRFWPRLTALLGRVVRHHSCVVFRYTRSESPAFVFGDLDSDVALDKFHEYRQRAYLLDPFYDRFRARSPDTVLRLRDVSADRFFRSVFYREYYRKTGLSDEMGIFCWTDSECLTIVSLARRVDEPAFTRAEIGRISGYFPIIAATIKLHDRFGRTTDSGQAKGPATDLALGPMLLPSSDLTARERAIGELILKGHSSLSIALILNISIETVRVHRRNLYRKLNVTSQAQLFALAIGAVTATPGDRP